jgi:hypothetical protein
MILLNGVHHSYMVGGTEKVENIPFEDIAYFKQYHEQYKNGLQIEAVIRKDLIDEIKTEWAKDGSNGTVETIIEKKYRRNFLSFMIRNQDMPKFRKQLIKLFETKGAYELVSQKYKIYEVLYKKLLPEKIIEMVKV